MSSALKNRLQKDLNEARKERDKLRTLVLSTTLSELRNREIELGGEADEQEVLSVITRAVKRRREAASQARDAARPEVAEREETEEVILSDYLPAAMTEDEVRELVMEIVADGVRELGPVMGRLMPRLKGRFDGKEANRIVREVLAE